MRQLRPWLLCVLVLSASLTSKAISQVQTPTTVDEARRTTLPGTVHPLALAKYDQGGTVVVLRQ